MVETSGTGEPVLVEGDEASEEAPEAGIGDKVNSGIVETVCGHLTFGISSRLGRDLTET